MPRVKHLFQVALLCALVVSRTPARAEQAAPGAPPGAVERVSTGRVTSAKLIKNKDALGIRGLRLSNPGQLIIEEKEARDGGYEYFVRISGEFTAVEDSVLMLNRQEQIAKIQSGRLTQPFNARVQVLSDRTDLRLDALSPSGKIESLDLAVLARFERASGSVMESIVSGWKTSLSLGPSVISHQESEAKPFDATTITFKASVDRRVVGPWSVGAFVFVTALPIQANVDGLSPTFLGMSLRASYLTDWLPQPWSLSWSAGFYYTSLFGVDETYGFTNIHGPQPIPYPTLVRKLSSTSTLSFTPKYSPIWATFPRGLMDHRQLALGLRFSRQINLKRSWFASLDYSQFKSDFNGLSVTSTSTSLAGGVSF